MKTVVAAFGFCMLAETAIAADQPCYTSERRGGLDFSLPCAWHSPIPAEDAVIGFASGSANLSADAQAILDRQAAVLARFPNAPVELVGHADTVEAPTASEQAALSQSRAGAVRAYLISRGIVSGRITASGRDYPFMIPRQLTPETLARMRVVFTQMGN
ncbi:MAG: OmpA family protein [Magnetospirillum sp.]|nr:OmpA family protein [Magnetospirillum sp.]